MFFILYLLGLESRFALLLALMGACKVFLLDNKSIVVAYDHKRGEKEATVGQRSLRKNEDRAAIRKRGLYRLFTMCTMYVRQESTLEMARN